MRRARKAARAPLANALALAALANSLAVVALVPVAPAPDPLSSLGVILPPIVSDNFDELVKAASATCEVLPQELLFSRASSLRVPHTQLVEFSHRRRRNYHVRSAHENLRLHDSIVLYVPGWWNTPNDASSQAIVKALMTKNLSVLLLDTRLSFCRGYISAVSNIIPLSYLLYRFIKNVHQAGFPISSIHLIGFSLGAHVAGITGKLVRENLNVTLGRITALDPAKPCFSRTENRLGKDDAMFVQVIHSSAGVLGLEEPLGHTDVYLNGVLGKHPECRNKSIRLQCDHAQAWKLFSASVVDENSLTGRRCTSWGQLLRNECTGHETILGYSCRNDSHGTFLYKSEETKKPELTGLDVFNPFDLLRWPLTWQDDK